MELLCPEAFSTFEDLSFGALNDEEDYSWVGHTTRRMVCGCPTACTSRKLIHKNLTTGWLSFVWSTWHSSSKEVSCGLSSSAASYCAIGALSAEQRRELSGTISSAKNKHIVLDPNGTSEGVAERRGRKAWPEGVVGRRGRKAWSEGVAERRGRKKCLLDRRVAARTFGVQFITVALVIIEYPDEAWVLIHSHAYLEKAWISSSH